MEKYLQIGKINFKHNIAAHAAICILLLCLAPLLIGTSNLPMADTARVLEMYTALIGIILFAPIFLPEQNKDLRDLVSAKYISVITVYTIRLLQSLLITALLLGAFIWMLHTGNCAMDPVRYYLGTLSGIIFFGGLGVFSYALCDNLIIGYLVPLFYYTIAMGSGSKYLKWFYPFSMIRGSYQEKYVLLVSGILLIAGGILLRKRKS